MTATGGDAAGPPARTRRAARNSFFNFLTFGYPTAMTIIVTPIALHYVGSNGYGIFALASVFVGFLSALDFGIGAATIKFVSDAMARGEVARARDIVAASLFVYAAVGVIGCSVALLIAFFFLDQVFHIQTADVAAGQFVFIAAGVGFFLTMLQTAVAAVPPALQRYGVTSIISLSMTTLTSAATIGVLVAGFGVRGMIVVAAIQPLLAFAAYSYAANWLLGEFLPLPKWKPALLKKMASFSGFAFLGNFSGLVLFQLDKILLGALGTTKQVTYYVVPGNVAQRLHTAAASMNAFALPATSVLAVSYDIARIKRLYARATRFTALFVATFAVPAILLAHPILQYWVGSEFARNSTLTLQLLAATYALLALAAPAYYIALGSDRPRITAAFNAAMAAINVPLVVILVPTHGNNGAAFAYLVSMAPLLVFLTYVERRVLSFKRSPWVGTAARLLVPITVQAALIFVLRDDVRSLPQVLLLLALTTALLPASYFGLHFASSEDRIAVRALLPRHRSAA